MKRNVALACCALLAFTACSTLTTDISNPNYDSFRNSINEQNRGLMEQDGASWLQPDLIDMVFMDLDGNGKVDAYFKPIDVPKNYLGKQFLDVVSGFFYFNPDEKVDKIFADTGVVVYMMTAEKMKECIWFDFATTRHYLREEGDGQCFAHAWQPVWPSPVIAKNLLTIFLTAPYRLKPDFKEKYNLERQKRLFKAARTGDAASVAFLLSRGLSPNTKDYYGQTALHRSGSLAVTQALIAAGADVNAPNALGKTPLFFAPSAEIARALLRAGAEVSHQDNGEETALNSARSLAVAKELVAAGADVREMEARGRSPLCGAASGEVAEYFIGLGASVEADCGSNSPLINAANEGREDVCLALIHHGASVNRADDDKATALNHASRHNNLPIVKMLVEAGARVNAIDSSSPNPLLEADATTTRYLIDHGANLNDITTALCKTEDIGKFKMLLAAGADITKGGDNQGSAIFCTDWSGEATRMLLERGASVNDRNEYGWTPLHVYAMGGTPDALRALLRAGADPNATDKNGETPLVYCMPYFFDCKILLDAGADPNAHDSLGRNKLVGLEDPEGVDFWVRAGVSVNDRDKLGSTPLHWAAFFDQPSVCGRLLDLGADLEARDNQKQTPLHATAYRCSFSAAYLLVSRGANIEAEDEDGWTPVKFAASGQCPKTTEYFIRLGAKVDRYTRAMQGDLKDLERIISQEPGTLDLPDQAGMTLLHYAMITGQTEYAQRLLAAGANVNATDQEGTTPLHIAARGDSPEAVSLLIKAGANVKAADQDGVTALHLVAGNYLTGAVVLLLEAGADAKATDKDGRTPLHYCAKLYDASEHIPALVAAGADINARDHEGKTPLALALAGNQFLTIDALTKAGGVK